jgi:tetratricopeptide (TPR) repeat protein
MLRALLVTAACVVAFARVALGTDASALFAEGERAFAAARYDEALRLFMAARAAGSAGPSSYYNIGVTQYVLEDYPAAEATFAALAAEFPAMRELAEYNRGLALRAAGNVADARVAFVRAQSSADDKIAALASVQLREIGAPALVQEPSWTGYVSGGLGYDDNVALVDDLGLASSQFSSPLLEAVGLLSRDFGARPWRIDASGYAVRYPDVGELDQTVGRIALATERPLGAWTLAAGPALGRSTLNGDSFEQFVGADLRLRRSFGASLSFEARAVYDDVDAGDARFDYIAGSRRQLRLAVQHVGAARIRVDYDVEYHDRADPGITASRDRWSVFYQRRLSRLWTADALLAYRTSRYDEASVPREERLVELSLAVRRDLRSGWTLSADYRWSDNDSTDDEFSYDGQRLALGLSRSFDRN